MAKFTKEMTMGEAMQADVRVAEVLMGMGMGCVFCPSAQGESLEEAAMVHGLSVDELMEKLNSL